MNKNIYKCYTCSTCISTETPEEIFLSFDCPFGHGILVWIGSRIGDVDVKRA